MTHEFGHRVDYVQRDRIEAWKLDLLRSKPLSTEVVIHPDIDGLVMSEAGGFDTLIAHLDDQLREDATRVSVYAQTNDKEAFAEAFAALYHHPDRADVASNATLDAYGRLARRELDIGYSRWTRNVLDETGVDSEELFDRNRQLAVGVYRQLGIRKYG